MPRRYNKEREMSVRDSNAMVRELLGNRESLQQKLKPGHIVFTAYDAKDKTQTYDRTPLILILRTSASYTLGLNFHWLPLALRLHLVDIVMRMNQENIRKGKRLEFTYEDLKPLMKSLRYAPCIRLYINKRLAKRGVVVPPERLGEVARLRAETFTNGRYSAAQLYRMARERTKRKKS